MLRILTIAFIVVMFASCREREVNGNTSDDSTLFSLLDPSSTGIDFTNTVKDQEAFNILTYRNFYNGGGVAIGDINNDSLPDLYFTANQTKNELYLNKGNFVFEEITDKAGVGGTKEWSTGVTMADVNGDGFLDIYVCNSGDVNGSLRENELFINDGDLTFTESAKKYNLNNEGYSTHAAFFDYDTDGDLDCYILNNSFKDPAKIELYNKQREIPSPIGDKLMRNDGEKFTDVTEEAGIFTSEIGFGLGVAVSDINNDQLPDIYISNDFWERDYLYINQGNGKFIEDLVNRIDYCSVSSMGADIADLNNDGAMEIFTTDMLPADNYRLKTTMAFDPYHLEDTKYRANFHYQMIQNCLHLNDGTGRFQEIAFLTGVAATDWSWGALIFDFENDGRKDIFVSNGISKDIMSMDFRDFLADAEKKRGSANSKTSQLDFISQIPAQPLRNYAFHNKGPFTFSDEADSLGLSQLSFSNGSAYGDLDGDGDQDLVVNNVNSPSFVYRNNSREKNRDNHFLKILFKGPPRNPFGIGALITLKVKDQIYILENFNTRGFQSSIEPLLLFGLGTNAIVDELKITWPDRKIQILKNVKADLALTLRYEDASSQKENPEIRNSDYTEVSAELIQGKATHHENIHNDFNDEILLVRMLSTEGPRIIKGDVNNDKMDDFLLLGATGDPDKLFLQRPNGTFSFRPSPAFEKDKGFESTCAAFFDHDRDGDLDLMIGSGGNEMDDAGLNYIVRFYKNNGNGNFTADPANIPQVVGNFSTMEAEDYDKDGDIDVFLGARCIPGNYGLPPKSYLLQNYEGTWVDVAKPSMSNAGMVTDATWSDVDNDGDKDLVVVGDWMPVVIFINDYGFEKVISIPQSSGWWNRVEASDLDGDGDTDFVLGNWGLNSKFKASNDKPLSMYVNDFDNNGKSEFIINWYAPLDTTAFPFALKPELTSQLPGLRKKILKFEDYARKKWDSLYSENINKQSLSFEVKTLQSSVLWNDLNSYRLEALPIEAQVSPVFGIATDDIDADGQRDILLAGNFYALKPQVGRQNSNKGIVLRGTKNNKFEVYSGSGFSLNGEAREILPIDTKGRRGFLVGRNNDSVLLFLKK